MPTQLGPFEQYRWLVRKSIQSTHFEDHHAVICDYLRLMADEFFVQSNIAESLIQFYVSERQKKNMPQKVEIFRRLVEDSTQDTLFLTEQIQAQEMFWRYAQEHDLPNELAYQIIDHYCSQALNKSHSFKKNQKRKQKKKPAKQTLKEIINAYRTPEWGGLLLRADPRLIDQIHQYCMDTDTRFIDEDFPHHNMVNQDQEKPLEYFEVKRISEFISHPVLLSNGASYKDVQQGEVGNCWLCSLIASFASVRPDELYTRIYPQSYNPAGIYVVEVYIGLQNYYVLIDDFIPVDQQNRPVFGTSRQADEIWFMLFEKAFAKLWGCYQFLDGDHSKNQGINKAFKLMADMALSHSHRIQSDNGLSLWKEIQGYIDEDWVVTISTDQEPSLEEFGLVNYHAYSVLATFQHKDEYLLVLRNPWGSEEWNGAWSDRDQKTEHLRKIYFNLPPKDDGIFFIPLDAVVDHFHQILFFRVFS